VWGGGANGDRESRISRKEIMKRGLNTGAAIRNTKSVLSLFVKGRIIKQDLNTLAKKRSGSQNQKAGGEKKEERVTRYKI